MWCVCVCVGGGGGSRQSLSTVFASLQKCLQPLQPSSDQFLPVSVPVSLLALPLLPPTTSVTSSLFV